MLQGITPKFEFEEVETKGKTQHIISGYISTPSLDLANDIVTNECMDDMIVQIKSGSIVLDFEHETIHNENLDMNPFGKIIEARKDSKGLWIKAILNSANKRFSEIWESIKGGFLSAFSIAFKPIEAVTKYIDGKAVRFLNKVKLVNVGMTGTPVNEECAMDKVFVKAIKQLEEETKEPEKTEELEELDKIIEEPNKESQSTTKEEVQTKSDVDDKNKMVEQEESETQTVEEASAESTEEEEVKTESESEESNKAEELETEVKALKKANIELRERLNKIEKDLEKPEFKAIQETSPQTKQNNSVTTPLQMI